MARAGFVVNPWESGIDAIVTLVNKVVSATLDEIRSSIEIPPDSKLGDVSSTIAFSLAKEKRQNPAQIAKEIVQDLNRHIKDELLVETVEAKGPYINFRFNRGQFAKSTIDAVIGQGENYGRSSKYQGLRALIESPAVNPNNPWHIGHSRNAIIGDTLGNLLEAAGYEVVRIDYINDLGLQIAQLVWKLMQGTEEKPDIKYDHFLGHLYVDVQKDFEENQQVRNEVREVSRQLEELTSPGAKANLEMVTKCLKAQCQTAYRLGIYHDYQVWESTIAHSGLLQRAKDMMMQCDNIVILEEGPKAGCVVAKLDTIDEFKDMKEPYKVLFRSDGTRTYTGADVAFQLWKFGLVDDPFLYEAFERQPNNLDVYKTSVKGSKQDLGTMDLVFNVIASEQSHPQKLVYIILDLLGYHKQSENSHHVAYEFVTLEDERFSGRKGTWIGYSTDIVLDKTAELAKEEVAKRNPDESDEFKEKVAEQIAVGAVRYFMLKASPDRKIVFRWEEVLDFNGDAAPYLQYSHARAQRILEKAQQSTEVNVDLTVLSSEAEFELVKALSTYPQEVMNVATSLKKTDWGTSFQSNRLAAYCYTLATLFSRFYDSSPVLKAEPELRKARLHLVDAFKTTMANCLGLLGIPAVERM